MRILITNTGPWGTGSFNVVKAITHEFLNLGHDVKVVFPDVGVNSPDKGSYLIDKDMYEIWEFPRSRGSIKLSTFPLMIPDPHPRNPNPITFKSLTADQLLFYFDDFTHFIQPIINKFEPDIIECQHIWSMDHVIQRLGHRFISTAHHSDQLGFHYDPRMRNITINSAKHAEFIFAISESVKKNILSLYGIDEEKVIVIGNGYEKALFTPRKIDREQLLRTLEIDIPKDATIINFTGKLSHTKGIDTILKANALLDANKHNIHFLILGAGDLNTVLDKNEIYSFTNTHFLGHRQPELVSQIHNISRISLMPSRTEGFGIAGLEAMGCGVPLITTRCGGPEHFAVGDIIDVDNPQQLADSIIKLTQMPEEQYNQVSQQAHQKAQQFSWHEIAEQRLHYYEKVTAGAHPEGQVYQ